MVQLRVLDRGNISQCIRIAVYIVPQRYQVLGGSLKMVMIRGRGTALGTVVEKGEDVVLSGKVKHVDVPVPDRLVGVPYRSYDQMVWEYRIRIDEYMVLLALAALELEHGLLYRTVFTAEKASAGCDGCLVKLRCRRYYPGRVELKPYSQSSGFDFTGADSFQSPVILACQRPLRELVTHKFMQYLIILHCSFVFWPQAPMYGSCPCRGCSH